MSNKLIVLGGYSGSGKDSIMSELVNRHADKIVRSISHTSRPIRPREVQGREYYFIDKNDFLILESQDMFVETRLYNTINNGEKDIWYYGLSKDELDLSNSNKITILDKGGCKDIVEYIGEENCITIYVNCDEEDLKERALLRGDEQDEFDRRLADDKIKFNGYEKVFHRVVHNKTTLEECVENVELMLRIEGLI